MKTKKSKILLTIIEVVLLVVVLTIGINVRNFNFGRVSISSNISNNQSSEEHEHEFLDKLFRNEENHWKQCLCGEKIEIEEHKFTEWVVLKEASEAETGAREHICTKCGYYVKEIIPKIEHKHTYSTFWSFDKNSHWHEATCSHKDVKGDLGEHNFVGDRCETCFYILDRASGIEYELNDDGASYTLKKYVGNDVNVVLPDEYNNLPITNIGVFAFSYMQLSSIVIGRNVKRIEFGAFMGCNQLTTVVLPEGLTYIGASGFESCPLQSINIPDSIEEIGARCFTQIGNAIYDDAIYCGNENNPYLVLIFAQNISTLRTLKVNEHTKVICDGAFENNEYIRTIEIPDNVEFIGERAFYNCEELVGVKLPARLKKIEKQLFFRCDTLDAITIPSNVEEIGEEAFYGCSNMYKIVIPSSIKKIGKDAFKNCNSLEEIIYQGTDEEWENIIMDGEYANPKIYLNS